MGLDAETIKVDLTSDRPIWPFSVYGPGRNAPKQLLEGSVEQSPEEVRLQYYLAMRSGNVQRAVRSSVFIHLQICR
jgi:nucleoporin NUP42